MSSRLLRSGTAALLAVFLGVLAPSIAAAEEPGSCSLVSPAKIRAQYAFPRLLMLQATSSDEFSDLQPQADWASAVNTVCNRLAWRGSTPPSTRLARDAALRAGEAAVVDVQTWFPYLESPQLEYWDKHAFGNLIEDFRDGRFHLIEKIRGRAAPLRPEAEGYPGLGATIAATGPLKGVEVAVACWWNATRHEAICLHTDEAAGRPAVADLNAFARPVVRRFLGEG
jgi:hypothetical protein